MPTTAAAPSAEEEAAQHAERTLQTNACLTPGEPGHRTMEASKNADLFAVRSGESRCLAQGRVLLREMNPTPAVCGDPRDETYAIIGEIEGFDR